MKTITRYLSIIALAFAASFAVVSAAEPVSAPVATSPADGHAATVTDYKDAFLKFALEKAEKYSGTIESAVSKGVDVAAKEAPELMKEFLHWRAFYNLAVFLIPVMSLVTCIVIFRHYVKTAEYARDGNPENGAALYCIFAVIGWVVSFVAALVNLSNLFTFFQIIIAPRVYIVEQVIRLVTK